MLRKKYEHCMWILGIMYVIYTFIITIIINSVISLFVVLYQYYLKHRLHTFKSLKSF